MFSHQLAQFLPDLLKQSVVPTIAAAVAPCFEATLWLGNMAPAATPADCRKAQCSHQPDNRQPPEIIAAWDRRGAIPMTMTPAELDAFLLQDIEKSAGGEVSALSVSEIYLPEGFASGLCESVG